MDFILISATSQVRDGLDRAIEFAIGAHDYIHTYVEIPTAMFIIEIAKRSEDKSEWFPHGKWSTIQAIQARIDIEINKLFTRTGE